MACHAVDDSNENVFASGKQEDTIDVRFDPKTQFSPITLDEGVDVVCRGKHGRPSFLFFVCFVSFILWTYVKKKKEDWKSPPPAGWVLVSPINSSILRANES